MGDGYSGFGGSIKSRVRNQKPSRKQSKRQKIRLFPQPSSEAALRATDSTQSSSSSAPRGSWPQCAQHGTPCISGMVQKTYCSDQDLLSIRIVSCCLEFSTLAIFPWAFPPPTCFHISSFWEARLGLAFFHSRSKVAG